MNIKDIKELVRIIGSSDVTEFTFEDDDTKIQIKRGSGEGAQHPTITHVTAPAVAPVQIMEAPVQAAPTTPVPEAPADDPNYHYISAPLVGTFYSSPAPDADLFAKEGDTVKVGQTICIVEAMKLMNEIESDVNGVVVKVLIDNASPVEFGTKLFAIKKS